MMSKKQWFVLLCVQFVYLLLGAAIFLDIESTEENIRREEEAEERREIAGKRNIIIITCLQHVCLSSAVIRRYL